MNIEAAKARMHEIYTIVVNGKYPEQSEFISHLLEEYMELDHSLEHYALSGRPS